MLQRSKLPPGVPFLIRRLFFNLAPATAILAASRLLEVVFQLRPPTVAIIVIALLSIPALYILRIVLHEWHVRRAAARIGAVLPPRWEGRSIGNMDILDHVMERFYKGYITDGVWDKMGELGYLYAISIMWDTSYFTTDANVTKAVLATEFLDFEKGDEFRDSMGTVLGTGVFNADGEMWKFHRNMTRPYFSRDRISHFELFDRHANLLISKMKDRFRGGHAVDFQDAIARFTLDSATEFLFGKCVNSLESDLPYAHNDPIGPKLVREPNVAERFAQAFSEAQQVIALRWQVGWIWHMQELLRDKAAEHMQVVDQFLQPILEEAIAKNRAAKSQGSISSVDHKPDENETLLDHLVRFTSDPAVLHDETLNILIAGRDTTATTLTYAVYLMCLYPDVFKRLRTEILEKLGPSQVPTFDDVRSLKYLRAVINETLRLYPAVPFNVRVANRDTTLPNPNPGGPRVFVPAKTAIAYSVFLMHRRKDYWGPDALLFDPDRWLDERLNKYFTANPFIFVPFNAGPRICLGQQFAYNEMSFFLIRLLQNFSMIELDLSAQPPDARPPPEWASAEGQKGKEKVIPKSHLTLYVQGGLWVKMTEAEKEA
ncbi:cytochrome P450 monooxygenase pc-3 [Trametes coccinea BRFM310]|uniref:Cytochrome P450 monooxygenase pc-3 n=1 Tax=Trametes coccinea (strain BRFM310) TaxID=1353009 RepID=A0A1Y2ICZ5_TRAC3|nr:cytochrome P450 monooxygenase pc-3 [Trametes coccinea BRFM310]